MILDDHQGVASSLVRNVICTPHLGHVENDTYETSYCAAIEQIIAFAAGKPINIVNP